MGSIQKYVVFLLVSLIAFETRAGISLSTLDMLNQQLKTTFTLSTTLSSFSNQTTLLTSPTHKIVLRTPTTMSAMLVNIQDEVNIINRARGLGYTPLRIAFYHPQNKILATHFIEFEKKKCTLQDAIALLKKLHSETLTLPRHYDLLARVKCLEHLMNKHKEKCPTELSALISRMKEYHSKVNAHFFQSAPIHGDPSPENFCYLNSQAYLLDWERSAMGDPMYDLAHLILVWNLSPIEEQEAYDLYRPQDTTSAKHKVNYLKAFVALEGLLWAYWHKNHGHFSFSHSKVADFYRNQMGNIETYLNSPSFKEALKYLSRRDHVNNC